MSMAGDSNRVASFGVEPGNEDAHLDFCCAAGVVSPGGRGKRCSKEFKATDSRKARKRGPASVLASGRLGRSGSGGGSDSSRPPADRRATQ